ncbi:hypothetical protein UVI_02064040 [Ustilaginoidea virens]|uniref:SAC domain-containing protein n=1 Tax=Ustilaginoidea virens TaxID=1159556 RepID=A0A1B5L7Y0_USTVR|nr:hypothetical protein UVI_02064040 [Ustilaginoidea virens]
MHKFSLYETASRYYVVGVDISEKRYRILKIDRTAEGTEMIVTDDKISYSLKEINQLLDTIDDGNRGTGGIKLRGTTWGIIGFIKFTGPYYMLLITKKSTVAMIGGHYIYQIEGTDLIPLTLGRSKPDSRSPEEQRFLGILNSLDLTKSFYYSYSYDITRTLQHNIIRERSTLQKGLLPSPDDDPNTMFIWNSYLLEPALNSLAAAHDWCRPIIHGYVDQAELNLVDPFYGAAAMHFNDLFQRYGAPIYVVNLIKSMERQPRESKLLQEYTDAIDYLNQFLPAGKRMIHKAWDMSRASKVRGGDVIGNLEVIAESVVTATGFFHNGDGRTSPMMAQNGVARTNCIDCLDRTNAAQFVIGKRALGHQLHALGILDDTRIGYDTDAVNLFTHMWHDHGDTVAVQYGGSQLVNTMETYRKINQWTSHSRDMIESFKRYYNNSFLDSQRQEAYNLFLGNYVYSKGQPLLWEMTTDYYLHHVHPKDLCAMDCSNYINWYTPSHLDRRVIPRLARLPDAVASHSIDVVDDYWLEYYRPATLSSFPKMFAYKMNSTIKYIPLRSAQDGRYDLSPFRVRNDLDVESDKRKRRESLISDNNFEPLRGDQADDDVTSVMTTTTATKGASLQQWLQPVQETASLRTDASRLHSLSDDEGPALGKSKPTALEKSNAAQWTFTKAVHDSLNPSVNSQEAEDYGRYIHHPQNLPLVVSSDAPANVDSSEYREYINGTIREQGIMIIPLDEDKDVYRELLKVNENPLTVTEEDATKKRYKAYGKWLHGKSFFKQQPLD